MSTQPASDILLNSHLSPSPGTKPVKRSLPSTFTPLQINLHGTAKPLVEENNLQGPLSIVRVHVSFWEILGVYLG